MQHTVQLSFLFCAIMIRFGREPTETATLPLADGL